MRGVITLAAALRRAGLPAGAPPAPCVEAPVGCDRTFHPVDERADRRRTGGAPVVELRPVEVQHADALAVARSNAARLGLSDRFAASTPELAVCSGTIVLHGIGGLGEQPAD